MDHPAFLSGNFDTNFVKYFFSPEILVESERKDAEIAAKVALCLHLKEGNKIREVAYEPTQWTERV
jgi:hypothetical protein